MIIDNFNYTGATNLPQQVLKNRNDIEELKEYIRPYYKCTIALNTTDELIARSDTNVPGDATKGFIVDINGKMFELITITDSDNIVISFWATLTIGG